MPFGGAEGATFRGENMSSQQRLWLAMLSIPDAPCMEYLPT